MRSAARISSHPLHPMLVAFPIALFVTGFIFDLIAVATTQPRLWAAGWYCIIGGLVGGFVAAVPGLIDYVSIVPPKSSGASRGLLHGGLNALILLLFIAIAVLRGSADTQPSALALILQAIGIVGLGISGWLGATLVYRNQIGIDHRFAGAGKLLERTLDGYGKPLCNQSELAEGQMALAHVETAHAKARVAVGRCAEGYAAFADRCTHKGGPLSDGALVGCTVQCPWHGSQFDIHTGRVVAGPATRQVTTYDTEIRKNEVYVAPKREESEKAA